ncbi:4Fe-4S dicluster domain-containing protein [Eggerthella sinensis]|uniref:4Fe-4S dicluster domain-containing protein n=1 Tax=Eggerthella sinensis TaxID=242230 RepID=UPI0022E22418|nr:4Fe-4S dicluster domain-containing protein [Eggerthella sinensis]
MQASTMMTRRVLLQGTAALGISALAVGGAACAGSSAYAEDASAAASGSRVGDVQYGFLVDLGKCVNCELCIEACRRENRLSDDTPDRRRITLFVNAKGENVTLSTSCMHCAEPSCLRVCPAGAITKGEAGIVSVDQERCIGCKYCFQACPYEVPRYNALSMDKCDCCLGAGVPAGATPHCVRACKFDALQYGPLEELKAQANGSAVPIAQENDPSCLLLGTRG